MTTGLNGLTEKEKDALRLLLRGHDAKSSARELGLSVHTVNERLRDARRKLGVTSSREAARRLLAVEAAAPETLRDKALGDATTAVPDAPVTASASQRLAWFGLVPSLALTLIGVLAMSLILAALLVPASPLSITPATLASTAATATAEPTETAAARSAEAFLKLVDEGRWAESFAATGAEFRRLNTLERWAEVSERVRPPLGKLLTRNLVANEFVPAPPKGYRLIKFRSTYANGTQQTESVSLAWEDGAWMVAGITFEADAGPTPQTGAPVDLDQLQTVARSWLALIDQGEWQASHTASGSSFRSAISASAWGQAAAQARQPLGRVVKRELLEYGSQSAPREMRIVLFRTDFANQTGTTETVTLEPEGDAYRVVGYWIK
jgi:DNA-binding CsgD family transcriptional regulator